MLKAGRYGGLLARSRRQYHQATSEPSTRATPAKLNLPALDTKWRDIWKARVHTVNQSEKKPKKYILPMFPYPSGDLHLGHLRVYTISDVLARFHRMKGFQVMHPIGWDAFGLPAENAAIERGISPETWTMANIAKMRAQLEDMNGEWNWELEFATCDPAFYKNTQLLFLLLHEAGLAYQADSLVNYDPVDKTVLANEQVDANGNSWRSGAKVEKRMQKQWFFRITAYQETLYQGLTHLERHKRDDFEWPERVLAMQKNWLGKNIGANIKFMIAKSVTTADILILEKVDVFTTRPETLFGVQFLALAPSHPLVQELARDNEKLKEFLERIPSMPPDSKEGFLLDVEGVNPLFDSEFKQVDDFEKPLPVYVASYVLGDVGSGAVMGVPGHDERDNAFWKQNCKGPIKFVLSEHGNLPSSDEPYLGDGVFTLDFSSVHGFCPKTAVKGRSLLLTNRPKSLTRRRCPGKKPDWQHDPILEPTWRLRDWLISRQRYWGTPIPIIHCETCGTVPVPKHMLPVQLPLLENHWDKSKTGNPLEHAHDWINTKCPQCEGPAKRETDTMDTFVDSSWYFMQFPSLKRNDAARETDAAMVSSMTFKEDLPVDIYVGGVEHAILHLLYARFIHLFTRDHMLTKDGMYTSGHFDSDLHRKSGSRVTQTTIAHDAEPFKKLITQGMVHGRTYSHPVTGRFLKPDEVDMTSNPPTITASGEIPNVTFEKMSKSKYNGVDPGACMEKYGADATRAHILFAAPVSETLEWDEQKIAGVTRWLGRLYNHIKRSDYQRDPKFDVMAYLTNNEGVDREFWRDIQLTIGSVQESYAKAHLNTVVSDLMTLTNKIVTREPTKGSLHEQIERLAVDTLLRMMAPVTPAFAEECWEMMYARTSIISIFDHSFPAQDSSLELFPVATHKVTVQVNGKVKFSFDLPAPDPSLVGEALDAQTLKQILSSEGAKKLLPNIDLASAQRLIFVPGGKIVNFVCKLGG